MVRRRHEKGDALPCVFNLPCPFNPSASKLRHHVSNYKMILNFGLPGVYSMARLTKFRDENTTHCHLVIFTTHGLYCYLALSAVRRFYLGCKMTLPRGLILSQVLSQPRISHDLFREGSAKIQCSSTAARASVFAVPRFLAPRLTNSVCLSYTTSTFTGTWNPSQPILQ